MARRGRNGKWIKEGKPIGYENLPRTKKAIDKFFIFGNKRGGEYREASKERYRSDFSQFFGFVKKEFDEVTKDDVEEYYLLVKKEYVERYKDKDRQNYNVANAKFTSLKAFYRYQEDEGLVEKSPIFIKFKRNKNRQAGIEKQIFTREEIHKIFSRIKAPRDSAVLSLLYGLGLRRNEILTLDVSDLDLDRRKLMIHGKGGEPRTNILKECILARLRLWLKVRRNKNKEGVVTDALFTSQKGNRLGVHNLKALMKKTRQRAGITRHFTPHFFRHTAVCHMLEDGVPLVEVSYLVGHGSTETTAIYIHASQMEKSYLNKFRDF